MDLADKSAVVTGGGNGIGRAICLALAGRGVNVGVADLEPEAAETVAAEVASLGVNALAITVDVSSDADMQRCAAAARDAFGSVEILVNNAGVLHGMKPLWQTTGDEFHWCFGVNVGGMLNGIRAFVPRFIESGRPAWVVNTGSEHSLGVPHFFGGLYTATKHAVLGLSDVLARELPEHVGVSVLCPGIVESTLWKSSERRQDAFGGAEAANEAGAAVMSSGMSADDVARRVVEGIEKERFYIVTHPHVVDYVRARWEAVESAFAEQAPRYEGDEAYDVNVIMQRLLAQAPDRNRQS